MHSCTFTTSASVFGMAVRQGDLVHADQHGALVVPPDVFDSLDSALDELATAEAVILGPAREPDFDIDKLEAAWKSFERRRT